MKQKHKTNEPQVCSQNSFQLFERTGTVVAKMVRDEEEGGWLKTMIYCRLCFINSSDDFQYKTMYDLSSEMLVDCNWNNWQCLLQIQRISFNCVEFFIFGSHAKNISSNHSWINGIDMITLNAKITKWNDKYRTHNKTGKWEQIEYVPCQGNY